MRTVKTKTEKQTLLISLIRFCAIGSVVRSDSFMDLRRSRRIAEIEERARSDAKSMEAFWCEEEEENGL